MINLCGDDHDEICYEGNRCPLCEMRTELERKIIALEGDVEALKEENKELRDELRTSGDQA